MYIVTLALKDLVQAVRDRKEIAGSAFASIGHILPTAWAMTGFQNIVVRGLGLNGVLLPAGLLLAYAAAFFGMALWRFRFE